jgi:hypothetical protein
MACHHSEGMMEPFEQPGHEYLSTACLHEQHDYCKSKITDTGISKFPAECKFCKAPCICGCHEEREMIEIPEPEPRWALYCHDDEVERFTWQEDAFAAGEYHLTSTCPKGKRKWAERLTIHWREDGLTISSVAGDYISHSYWRAEIEGVSLDHTVRFIIEGES